jgi:hypothetical protein
MKMQLFSINHNIAYSYEKPKHNSSVHTLCTHHQDGIAIFQLLAYIFPILT